MHTAKQFKTICTLEGISALALFLFAMPAKYIYQQPIYVEKIGMLHGILFVAYILWAFFTQKKLQWSASTLFIICMCGAIPGATFWVDRKYLKTL